MKEKLLKNWGLKIMAVLISFLIWFLVANIEDYSISKTITGIPVAILNEEAITSQDMVYEVVQGRTVDIKVEGRRSVVEALTIEDFTASADLSELSITNSVQITVDAASSVIRREINISVVDSTMKVAIEERGEQKLPITVVTMGETQEGYAVVSAAATPNMVTVTGAASKVKDIKTVRVEVDVEGLNTSISTRGELILLDADGEPIASDKINRNLSSVSVKVVIQKTKEVPIQIVPSGEVAEGYSIAGPIEYQPTTVLVAGEEAVLRSLREISIEDIDITGLNSDFETTVDINNYLPDGVVIADSTQNIAIKINIEKLIEKTITIRREDIAFEGMDSSFQYEVLSEEKQFELTVTGLKRDLDSLTVQSLHPTIQVSDYTSEGTYNVKVEMQELENIQYGEIISTRLAVSRIESVTEEDTTADAGTTETDTNH
ncbi:MAG: CdaR family protein [Bacteroides sp.]|nr:CdaR family protein [Bacteroides sp.]MCM1550262.1 CdaR family protein [Clostridium sp.]